MTNFNMIRNVSKNTLITKEQMIETIKYAWKRNYPIYLEIFDGDAHISIWKNTKISLGEDAILLGVYEFTNKIQKFENIMATYHVEIVDDKIMAYCQKDGIVVLNP